MGFLKTLFTGKRDELSEEEKKQFEATYGDLDKYQPSSDEESSNEEPSQNEMNPQESESSSQISLEDVLNYIKNSRSDNELIKIKNTIAQVEDEQIDSEISQLREDDDYEIEESNKKSQDIEIKEDNDNMQDGDEDFIEIDDSNNFDELDDKDDTSKKDMTETKSTTSSSTSNPKDLEDEDVSISIQNEQKENHNQDSEKSYDSSVDPPLFSVIHDELMNLFEDGTIVLLKEEFTFPSIGTRETLAFGIYNSSISNLKDQTHWFVQKLKQFSRLKECKMLLSEEYEKDLILEINETHIILLCFKTSNLIQDEFIFNRKWD